MAAESVPTRSTHAIPSSIGRYDILSLLGEGGMARVFLALRRDAFGSEKLVVIKQVRPQFAADSEFLTMFMDESRIALQLNHPNVVHTYEVVAEDPDYFLSMEFLEGRTLAQVLRKYGRRSFPVDLHIWILTQVLAGLQYAHELRDLDGTPLGIVHRDVNPSNVLITSTGEVKLLDFGIAKAAGAATFTQQGVVKGKLGYAAPEQCLGRASDARTDLFAVGMMLWEAIAGQRRSAAESNAALLQARVTNKEPSIDQVVPDVSPRLAEVCQRALAYSLEERYSSAAEFKSDLDAYLEARRSRLSAANLAEPMARLFAEDFSKLRGQIEAYVQEGRRASASARHLVEPNSSKSGPHVLSVQQAPASKPPLEKVRFKKLWIALAGSAIAGTLLASVLASKDKNPNPSEVTSATTVRSVGALTASPSAGNPPSAVAPSVRLAIAATPKRAQVWLDGRRISNPFVGELPRDDRDHELEVRASGYQVEQRLVRLSEDVALTIELRSEQSRGKPPILAARPGLGGSSAQQAPSSSLSQTQPGVRASANEPLAQPGQSLTRPPRVVRAIDEKDPY
jgi:eukaryotic-like serine/threonine-protein kinase